MSGSHENISTMASKQPLKPLKRLEIPLSKFNDVAVPHHVDLLKKHRSNIEKFQRVGDWDRMHLEQVNATRLIKQMKGLIYEIDMLRSQVQDSDVQKFDSLTEQARRNAQDAIKEYLDLNTQSHKPVWITSRGNSINKFENVSEAREEGSPPELRIQSSGYEELAKQEQCLKSWENLHSEVQDVHQLIEDFSLMVQEQKEKVDATEHNTEEAAENVMEGTSLLGKAARYRAVAYPVAGAVIGGCLGGPIGLLAGIKMGGLAALGCGFIGFTGGQLLKKKQEADQSKSDVELVNIQRSYSMKGSVSLPHISDTKSADDRSTDMQCTTKQTL